VVRSPGYRRRLLRANGTANTNINGTVVVNNNATLPRRRVTASTATITQWQCDRERRRRHLGLGASMALVPLATVLARNIAVNVAANATVSGGSIFGIQASENEAGSVSVTTAAGDLITAAAAASMHKACRPRQRQSSVTVIANATIHSGTNLTPNGSTPAASRGLFAEQPKRGERQRRRQRDVQSNATIVAAAGQASRLQLRCGHSRSSQLPPHRPPGPPPAPRPTASMPSERGGNVSITNGGQRDRRHRHLLQHRPCRLHHAGERWPYHATASSGINPSQSASGATGSATTPTPGR